MDGTRLSLLARVRDRGDDAAWAEFRDVYQPLLARYVAGRVRAHRLGWGPHEVEDAVHDIFVRLWKSMEGFELDHGIGRFRTYLWKVASNHVADEARRHARGTSSGGRILDEGQVDLAGVASGGPDPAWVRDFNETFVHGILRQLREETLARNANKWLSFERHWLEGQPAADVARGLSISADLVYQNASRMLRALRDRVRAEAGEDLLR